MTHRGETFFAPLIMIFSLRFALRFAGVVALTAARSSLAADPVVPAEDTVLRAMRDELARSAAQLKLEGGAPPYFVAYRVEDTAEAGVTASFGSIVTRAGGLARGRTAAVEVRVGSPRLDQTNFLANHSDAPEGPRYTGGLPLDHDYAELRRQLWLLTDTAYKGSVGFLAKKTAELQNKTRPDDTGDFTSEPPTQTESLVAPLVYDAAAAEQTARELSAVFREFPAVATSNAEIKQRELTVRYVNSEGTAYTRRETRFSVVVEASARAADGRELSDVSVHYARTAEGLPSRPELLKQARELGQRLTARRAAALIETYNGPVLFEGSAAAQVFAQGFLARLIALKRPVLGDKELAEYMPHAENPFMDKLGARVLPRFLSVSDDPTRREIGGVPLLAAVTIDDEGVPTRAVKLVEAGRLKTLLTSRVPSPGLLKSTGSRHGGGPFPTNVIVTSEEGLAPEALKARLLKLAQQRGRDYAVIIRRLVPEVVAVKLFPDGHEEPLRNVEVSETSTDTFKDIDAAGIEPVVEHLNINFPRVAGRPSNEMVSFAVPALLFDELTLKKPDGDIPKLPVVGHPFFEK